MSKRFGEAARLDRFLKENYGLAYGELGPKLRRKARVVVELAFCENKNNPQYEFNGMLGRINMCFGLF